MLFDGALIAGRCTTDLNRAGDTRGIKAPS
jgi:hypothetical protein